MSTQETTTPPPMSSPIRKLTRRRDNKVIAGVCSGLADYTGLDPIIFRIVFIGLFFAGGSGFLLYGLAWLFVPEAGSERAHGQDLLSRFDTKPWLGVALVIAGGALLLSQIGLWRPPVVWGCALLILGFILFREHDSGSDRRAPRTAPATVPASSQGYLARPGVGPDEPTTTVMPPAAVAVPRPPRERSALGWYTIAATLVALGVAALLDASNVISLTLVQYLALPLAVIGAGLIVGAWLGRSRLLIFLGILLVPFVLLASLIHVPLTGNAGSFVFRPQSAADIPGTYHIAAGDLTVDLRRFALTSGTTDVSATVGAGRVLVLVPPRVPLQIDGRTGLGTVNVFGRDHSGAGVHFRTVASSSASPGLYLHLEAGLGEVEIQRARPGVLVKPGLPSPPGLP